MLKAKYKQSKDCTHCGNPFERKRGTMTDAAWEKARFCGRRCYHSWQREQGPRGSDGVIRECDAPHCTRTFWAYRSQRFCRDTGCIEQRELQSAREAVKRDGSADALERFDAEARKRELGRLINEQREDERMGLRAWAGTKNSPVLGFDDLVHLARSGASAGDADVDPLAVVEFDEYEPFRAKAPHTRAHSHVPSRASRERQRQRAGA